MKRIEKMRGQIVPAAAKLRAQLEAEEKERVAKQEAEEQERKAKQEAEDKRQKWLASMTPAERKVRALAKKMSDSGTEKEKAKEKQIAAHPNAAERQTIQERVAAAHKLFQTLGGHVAAGTLNVEVIQSALHDATAPGETASKWMEFFTFEEDNPEFAYILVDEGKLITRIDVYHEVVKTLSPMARKTAGFAPKFLERYQKKYGDKRMWDFYIEQAKAGTEPQLGKRAEE